jgi:ubiquinone/menaquinone biosynthesis C-methylase UbiE
MSKTVLDVCCGGKMFYFNKTNPLVHFCDIRHESQTLCDGRIFTVSPDTVCDFTNLPFQDDSFHMVVFDPPHLVKVGRNSWLVKKYGKLPADFTPLLTAGFRECFRVLKPNGTLIFKWNETDIKVSEVIKLTDQKPLLGQMTGKNGKTHWIVFMKDSEGS